MNKSYADITVEKVQRAIATRRNACKDGQVTPSEEASIAHMEQEALDAAMASRDSYQLAQTISRPSIQPMSRTGPPCSRSAPPKSRPNDRGLTSATSSAPPPGLVTKQRIHDVENAAPPPKRRSPQVNKPAQASQPAPALAGGPAPPDAGQPTATHSYEDKIMTTSYKPAPWTPIQPRQESPLAARIRLLKAIRHIHGRKLRAMING